MFGLLPADPQLTIQLQNILIVLRHFEIRLEHFLPQLVWFFHDLINAAFQSGQLKTLVGFSLVRLVQLQFHLHHKFVRINILNVLFERLLRTIVTKAAIYPIRSIPLRVNSAQRFIEPVSWLEKLGHVNGVEGWHIINKLLWVLQLFAWVLAFMFRQPFVPHLPIVRIKFK